MTDELEALRTILTELQTTLQRRLDEIGAPETPHVLMAVGQMEWHHSRQRGTR